MCSQSWVRAVDAAHVNLGSGVWGHPSLSYSTGGQKKKKKKRKQVDLYACVASEFEFKPVTVTLETST
jgi:hypothetical protein